MKPFKTLGRYLDFLNERWDRQTSREASDSLSKWLLFVRAGILVVYVVCVAPNELPSITIDVSQGLGPNSFLS